MNGEDRDSRNESRVLIVDDDPQIRRALATILSSRELTVSSASDGAEALRLATESVPDLVITDLAMPRMDGFELCRSLRTWSDLPILVLSVREDEADKIRALDLGADDYLVKPFSAGELLARVRALLRRGARAGDAPSAQPIIRTGDLEIDLPARQVRRGQRPVELTRTEFDILAYLARNAGRVVSSQMILQKVRGPLWGDDTGALRVHISHLRRKIEPAPALPRYLITEPGIGYRLTVS